MTALYEVELDGTAYDGEPYYHTTIVRGPDAPAGEVPDVVARHARLLACIAGSQVMYRIGWHEPTTLAASPGDADRFCTSHAATIWLTEPKGASQR